MSRTQQTKQATPAQPLVTLGETERWEVIEEIAREAGVRFGGYDAGVLDTPSLIFEYKCGNCYLGFTVRMAFSTTDQEDHQLTADELPSILKVANQIIEKMAEIPVWFHSSAKPYRTLAEAAAEG
jgi:hypothetical protein